MGYRRDTFIAHARVVVIAMGTYTTTHLERHTNELQDLENCKVIGVNTDTNAIRVTVLEDDSETRSEIEDMAYDWMYNVEEVKTKDGAVLLEIKEDNREELDF